MTGKRKKAPELDLAMEDALANENLDSLLRRRSTELAVGVGNFKKFIEEIEEGFLKTAPQPQNPKHKDKRDDKEHLPKIVIVSQKIPLEKVKK